MAKKEAYYFAHDCNARQDEKILALRMKHGWEGYGLFWAIIERLRTMADYECVKDYNIIAFDLRVGANMIKSVVEDFGLFSFTDDGKRFYSERLKRNMAPIDERVVRARENGAKGGNPNFKKGKPNPYYNEDETGLDNGVLGNVGDNQNITDKITETLPKDNRNISYIKRKEKENNNISPIPNGTGDSTHASKKAKGKLPEGKKQYAEFVHLLEKEFDTLVKEFGEKDANRLVEILNNYKGASGKNYKSDYLAIRNWVVSRLEEEKRKNNGQQSSIRSPRGPNEGTGGGGYTSTI